MRWVEQNGTVLSVAWCCHKASNLSGSRGVHTCAIQGPSSNRFNGSIIVRCLPLALTGLALTACGDGTGPGLTEAEVAGAYVATTLTIDGGTGAVDQLALGATIQLTLTVDGNTAGLLIVPGGATDGSDFEADLAGTWILSGQAVRLSHVADSFLNDVIFAYTDGTLTGIRADDDTGTTIRVVLSR